MERSTSSGSAWEDPAAMLAGSRIDQLVSHAKSRGQEDFGRDLCSVPGRFWRPETFVIFSSREVPPSFILASRRSRRRRACFWLGVSTSPLCDWGSGLSMLMGFDLEDVGLRSQERS